jgi:S-(hydroxymethyl)glutathione dehydrogenase/alcohol dehydrogenase
MISSKAFILRRTGEAPKLEEIQVEDDLHTGQVLVRILYSAVCATQLEEIFVSSRNKKYMPHLFGHEGVGVIEKVGPGVTRRAVGEICVVHWRKSSAGVDAEPGQYFHNGKRIGAGRVVTFSEHAVLPENRVTPLPTGVDVALGSLLGCAYSTGWGAVHKNARVSRDDRVLICGLGGVGLAALDTCISKGVGELWTLDDVKDLDFEFENGLRIQKFRQISELEKELSKITVAIDTTGSREIVESLVDSLPLQARLILVGMPKSSSKTQIDTQRLLDGLKLIGSNGGQVDPATDFEKCAQVMRKSNFHSAGFSVAVENRLDFANALNIHRSGKVRRVILKMQN